MTGQSYKKQFSFKRTRPHIEKRTFIGERSYLRNASSTRLHRYDHPYLREIFFLNIDSLH